MKRGVVFVVSVMLSACATEEESVGESVAELNLPANLAPSDPRWSFQGAFQFDDCGANNVGNSAWSSSGPLQCPAGTISGTRSYMPESNCGGNQYQCEKAGFSFSTSLKFGGMFQVDDCGADNIGNAMQSGGFGCPFGYFQHVIGRVKAPESNCGAWQYVCGARPSDPPTNNPLQDKYRWGGQYQVDDCGTDTRANPLTGAPNCPTHYFAVAYGRAKAPEGNQCGVWQYVCVGKEP